MRAYQFALTEYVLIALPGQVHSATTGFQCPADDYEQRRIDLGREPVTTIASVFRMRFYGGRR